jgi:hypothetical protein
VTGAFITGQTQALHLIEQLIMNNNTEMLVKANTDDFNKIQWKREEPPWQTPVLSRHLELMTTNAGAGQAPTGITTKQDVAQKPICGLTTKILSSFVRLVNQTVYYLKNVSMDINA